MGGVFTLKCSQCGYKSVRELWIAHRYREFHDTEEEIRSGEWGSKLQEIMSNKHNRINIEEHLFVCDSCRAIDARPSLAYRINVKPLNCAHLRSSEEIMAEMRRHNKEDFEEPVKYPHLCNECGDQMREIFNPEEEGPILCPTCGTVLEAKFTGVS